MLKVKRFGGVIASIRLSVARFCPVRPDPYRAFRRLGRGGREIYSTLRKKRNGFGKASLPKPFEYLSVAGRYSTCLRTKMV
jgi:hypothetical protein